MLEIWQPRWRDRTVLVATYKIAAGKNLIRFTKTPSMPGVYSFDGDEARKCEVVSNGKIKCYAIPLDQLKKEPG